MEDKSTQTGKELQRKFLITTKMKNVKRQILLYESEFNDYNNFLLKGKYCRL